MLAELTEDKRVNRSPGGSTVDGIEKRSGIELRLSDDEEDKVSRIFGSLAPERRFTFEVRAITAR